MWEECDEEAHNNGEQDNRDTDVFFEACTGSDTVDMGHQKHSYMDWPILHSTSTEKGFDTEQHRVIRLILRTSCNCDNDCDPALSVTPAKGGTQRSKQTTRDTVASAQCTSDPRRTATKKYAIKREGERGNDAAVKHPDNGLIVRTSCNVSVTTTATLRCRSRQQMENDDQNRQRGDIGREMHHRPRGQARAFRQIDHRDTSE